MFRCCLLLLDKCARTLVGSVYLHCRHDYCRCWSILVTSAVARGSVCLPTGKMRLAGLLVDLHSGSGLGVKCTWCTAIRTAYRTCRSDYKPQRALNGLSTMPNRLVWLSCGETNRPDQTRQYSYAKCIWWRPTEKFRASSDGSFLRQLSTATFHWQMIASCNESEKQNSKHASVNWKFQ